MPWNQELGIYSKQYGTVRYGMRTMATKLKIKKKKKVEKGRQGRAGRAAGRNEGRDERYVYDSRYDMI
ncbi:hypothetical protein EAF00_009098 [Botryotinia globosa]|nr:hypothetical protein EAF00_009098 [Botryotinia globosa]